MIRDESRLSKAHTPEEQRVLDINIHEVNEEGAWVINKLKSFNRFLSRSVKYIRVFVQNVKIKKKTRRWVFYRGKFYKLSLTKKI